MMEETAMIHVLAFYCPTLKVSHDGSWRAACRMTIWIPGFHLEVDEGARGVKDPGVGCTDLLGGWCTSILNSLVFFP